MDVVDDAEEPTQPGRPLMLTGPPEARLAAELAVFARYHGERLDRLAAELRQAPMNAEQRARLAVDLRDMQEEVERGHLLLVPPVRRRIR